MDYWPELEDAFNQREAERQRSISEYEAREFVRTLEKKIDEKAKLMERLEPWKHLEIAIQTLAKEYGQPVADALKKMCIAYWKLSPDDLDRLRLQCKLIVPDIQKPPQLYWEAYKGSWLGPSLFVVTLQIAPDGNPEGFGILVNERRKISTAASLEALKEGLVEAFKIGPFFNRNFKSVPGIPLELESFT